MTDSEKCPLDKGPCIYTDKQVLGFIMEKTELPEECMTVFCPNFRRRLGRLVREDQRKRPVADLGLVARMHELEEAFEDSTVSGMFG